MLVKWIARVHFIVFRYYNTFNIFSVRFCDLVLCEKKVLI